MRCNRRRPLRARARRATAAVELAVCLPVIIVLVFGSIECCSMVFLDEALYVAAYEGARVAVQDAKSTSDVSSWGGTILTGHGVNSGSVTTSPAEVNGLAHGTTITVTATAPCNSNRSSPSIFFGGKTLTATCTMNKE